MVAFDPERNPLEILADDFTARCRRGESPSITEYTAEYPELAEQIEDLFPSISMMEDLVRQEQFDRNCEQTEAAFTSTPIKRIGDCRIIREISRGGMGIVYEAHQESLDRRVAIKVLPTSAVASPNRLERFQREAQAAASLHHTNIVSVFGVGQQDGLHYYLMQFISGVGMDQVLNQLRLTAGDRADAEPGRRPSRLAERAALSLQDGSFVHGPNLSSSHQRAAPRLVAINDPSITSLDQETAMASSDKTDVNSSDTLVHSVNPLESGSIEGDDVSRRRSSSFQSAAPENNHAALTPAADESPAEPREAEHRLGARYWRSVATVGIQLARALEYAHTQGVLHRDIKPANLLLDTTGSAWITDFGLAKSSTAGDLTKTGDIMGTLRYMAPEQLQGVASASSDLYSLGLTLYELLTLQPACCDDHQGRIIQQISSGTLPTRPRKINPRIPADLEMIVFKAIAPEPAHRFSTAGALADDLQRFLDDRPILARHASPAERLWRWCKRQPAVAGLTGIALLLLLLVTVSTTIGYVRTTAAYASETEQRQRAEATLGISLEALDKVYRRFAPDRMFEPQSLTVEDADGETIEVPTQAVLSKDTAALLEEILEFYNRFAAQDSENEALRVEAAKANRRIGDIQSRLGQFEAAEAAYHRAIKQYAVLHAAADDQRFETEIARIHNELGNVYRSLQQHDKSRAEFQASLDLLSAPQARSAVARFELARTHYFLGRGSTGGSNERMPGPRGPGPPNRGPGFRDTGPTRPDGPPRGPGFGPSDDAARGGRRRGPRSEAPPFDRPLNEPPFKEPPLDDARRPGPRDAQRGGPPGPAGARPSESLASLETAIGLLTDLQAEQPGIPEYPYLLALCYRAQARAQRATDLSKPIELLLQLAARFPSVADYRFQLAETYADLEPQQLTSEELEWAEHQLREANRYADALAIEHPHIPEYARARAHICHKLAIVIRRGVRGRLPQESDAAFDESEALLRESVRIHTVLLDQFPAEPSYQFWLPAMQRSLAQSLADRGKLELAASVLEASINGIQTRLDTLENPWFAQRSQAEQLRNLASLYQRQGLAELAEQTRQQADALGGRPAGLGRPNRGRPGPADPRR